VRAVVEPPARSGARLGARSTNLIREGVVHGERISGRVVPGGGDWMVVDASGTGHIDARYIIETTDGALVHVFYSGRLVFHGDALRRLLASASLAEADTYFRIAPMFAASEPYGWLNDVQAIGTGRVEAGEDRTTIVEYRVFEVL
jgi:hypothetical protein